MAFVSGIAGLQKNPIGWIINEKLFITSAFTGKPDESPASREANVIQRNMYPEIYTTKENSLIKSLMCKFREVISDDESLYGFSLEEFDIVMNAFPDVDLIDEEPIGIDNSWIVLNNMYAFLLDNNPKTILKPEEEEIVKDLWNKLKNV